MQLEDRTVTVTVADSAERVAGLLKLRGRAPSVTERAGDLSGEDSAQRGAVSIAGIEAALMGRLAERERLLVEAGGVGGAPQLAHRGGGGRGKLEGGEALDRIAEPVLGVLELPVAELELTEPERGIRELDRIARALCGGAGGLEARPRFAQIAFVSCELAVQARRARGDALPREAGDPPCHRNGAVGLLPGAESELCLGLSEQDVHAACVAGGRTGVDHRFGGEVGFERLRVALPDRGVVGGLHVRAVRGVQLAGPVEVTRDVERSGVAEDRALGLRRRALEIGGSADLRDTVEQRLAEQGALEPKHVVGLLDEDPRDKSGGE